MNKFPHKLMGQAKLYYQKLYTASQALPNSSHKVNSVSVYIITVPREVEVGVAVGWRGNVTVTLSAALLEVAAVPGS